ncbi:MAG TPA: UDP-2,3-diacylglucosamine diphosphatase, partial [Alcanivorax sp.]|nr:UDP-2,3-diacylglucosamine diphosphatase [Alcanivorax sp.]
MHGNRDFLLGDQFADDCGGVLLDEGTVVDLYGTRALLMHGDSLCTEDHAYQQFRAMARDPQWQQGMLAKPLEERRALAQGMRMQSQGNNANKPENIMDVTPAEVVRVMEDAGVRHLIHGHTHRPAVHDVALKDGTGTRWVLGDWGELGWWIVADSDGLRLENWEIS